MQTRCALVGMPGSGKSTVGRHLARRLGLPFVDLDQQLEQQLGCSIRAYFEQHGEAAFREREAQALAELARQDGPMVLSTGGGAVLGEANRAALRQGFAVMYLRASPEDIFRRVKHDTKRPLLQVPDPLGRLRELYQARDPLYREAAHYVMECSRPSVHGLVSTIAMQLEMAQGGPEAQPSP